MKIVYIILAHQYPKQVARLVNQLNYFDATFFIHIDKKAASTFEQTIVDNLTQTNHIHFIPRQKVEWGRFSLVNATLRAIYTLLQSDIPFDYVRLLSGQCYPIKTNLEIHSFLCSQHPLSFMSFFPLPSELWVNGGDSTGGISRINRFYISFLGKTFRLPIMKRKLVNLKPFGGSQFWCLTKECIEYIVQYCNLNPSYIKFFKLAYIPDEIFFQTILLNFHFRNKIIDDCLLFTEWNHNATGPGILNKNHLSYLKDSSCLFARKFDIYKDAEILNLIDWEILK